MRRPVAKGPLFRIAPQWLLGALLVLALGCFFIALNAVQLTSPGTGQRILQRAVAVLTDLDAMLPKLQQDVQAAAATTDGDNVGVPGFPIAVELPRREAADISQEALRQEIVSESARKAYREGLGVLAAADPEAHRDIELLSAAGAIDRGLGLITEDSHARLRIAAVVLGVIAALLATAQLRVFRSHSRLLAAGGILLAVSLPPLAAAVALRFGFGAAQTEADPFVNGLLELGMDAMGVPIRIYMALAALGGALLVLGVASAWTASARRTASTIDRSQG